MLTLWEQIKQSTLDFEPRKLIEEHREECMLVDDDGNTLLHWAAQKGFTKLCFSLLQVGKIPWNAINNHGVSIGELAKENGHVELYQQLVMNGVRTEFILCLMGQRIIEDGDVVMKMEEDIHLSQIQVKQVTKKEVMDLVSNTEYLNRKLTFSDDGSRLLDSDANAVMMGWEKPLMELHCRIICPSTGLRVLNVGFGLGIIDKMLQLQSPVEHTIIEAHPDVYQKMIDDGWDKKPGVKILFGRWQDLMDQLQLYDGIFFDTFGEYYDDLKQFHQVSFL
jgi:type IV protein arginine methyltransferase